MYLTVDCAKLDNGVITLYEFYDITTDHDKKDYYSKKIKELRKLSETVYIIYYVSSENSNINNISITKFSNGTKTDIFTKVDFDTFKEWYTSENGDNKGGHSKKFGFISDDGDKYIEKLLTKLVDCDLTTDNNGRKLIIPALKSLETHFFDFDLLHSKNKFVIEFLKNESHIKKRAGKQNWDLSNGATHPNRYWGNNKRKFITLWEATKILNSELYLVSYSDDQDELLHLMKVDSISENGIESDIGILLKYENFIEWLKQMDKSSKDGSDYLNRQKFPSMVRDQEFWAQNDSIWKKELNKFGGETK